MYVRKDAPAPTGEGREGQGLVMLGNGNNIEEVAAHSGRHARPQHSSVAGLVAFVHRSAVFIYPLECSRISFVRFGVWEFWVGLFTKYAH